MDYSEFRKKILEELKDFYGKDAYVKIQKIYKNNNTEKYGVVIKFTESEMDNIAPVIYLEELYYCYDEGSMDMEDCIGEVINSNEEILKLQEEIKKTSENIMEWESARHNIYPILLSRKDNKNLLKDLVTIDMLDLVVAYMLREETADKGFSSIKINNFLLDIYGISKEELHAQALLNIQKDDYKFYKITEILEKLIKNEPFTNDIEKAGCIPDKVMYIMTNASMFYGTAGILNSQWLHEKTGGVSCYIIPSSIHELIFVPDNGDICQEELDKMVQEVNSLILKDDERLSEHCYYYNAATGEIMIRK